MKGAGREPFIRAGIVILALAAAIVILRRATGAPTQARIDPRATPAEHIEAAKLPAPPEFKREGVKPLGGEVPPKGR